MKRKNIGIVAIGGGLLAAAFVAGGLLLKDGSGTTRVVVAGAAPTATAAVPQTPNGTADIAPDNGETIVVVDTSGGSEQPQQPQGDGGQLPQPHQPQGNGGQQPLPQPENPAPQPQPEPQPEPEPDVLVLNAPPSVVKVVPADDATGAARNSNIAVHFSEPMDRASAQAAFKMTNPLTPGVFSWNEADTVMTFNPNADFAYGAQVQYLLLDIAKDKAGASMAAGFEGTFKVIRRSTTTLYSQAGADGTVYAPAVDVFGPKAITNGLTFDVGTWQRGFVSFNLASLPADLTKIESAEFSIYQVSHDAAAYTASTGNLVLKSLTYGTLDVSDWGRAAHQFCLGPCVEMQVTLSASAADGWKGADVLGMVNLDWAQRASRNNQSQFRLQFVVENNGAGADVSATFATGQGNARPVLEITYLHP